MADYYEIFAADYDWLFDDDALFYLMSRGVPEDVARRLVVRSFFADVIAAFPEGEVRDRVSAALDDEINAANAEAASV